MNKKKELNLDDLLFTHVVEKSNSEEAKRLREHLKGKIQIKLSDSDRSFSLDWKKEELVVKEGEGGKPDCTVTLSEPSLLELASGKLDPQIAMLSDKVKVEGNSKMGMYLFNLLG